MTDVARSALWRMRHMACAMQYVFWEARFQMTRLGHSLRSGLPLVVSLGVDKSPSLTQQQHNARAYGTVASLFVSTQAVASRGFVVSCFVAQKPCCASWVFFGFLQSLVSSSSLLCLPCLCLVFID